jgi:LPS O-antigen subunit length determinant protein (WzzB/FepE family)
MNEIKLKDLASILKNYKYQFIIFLFLSLALTSIYSLFSETKYTSISVLVPNERSNKIQAQNSPLGSLIALSSGSNNEKVVLATAVSNLFLEDFILRHDIYSHIISNTISPDIHSNTSSADGISSKVFSKHVSPLDLNKALKIWREDFFEINQESSGIITFSLNYIDPILAQSWLTLFINDLNEFIRSRDMHRDKTALNYLTNEYNQVNSSEIKNNIAQLIKDKQSSLSIAHADTEYALIIIDPPSLPTLPSNIPYLILVCLGILLATITSFIIAIVRYSLINKI